MLWEKFTSTSDTIKNSWRHTTLLQPNAGIDEECYLPESISSAIVDS